mmetsp:Transcript_2165/g.3818  ORF Transcript_2165/g.3818 Transcript_2165/m.3818 type:complete len:230 (+) Transcript_2165:3084-3773(+)
MLLNTLTLRVLFQAFFYAEDAVWRIFFCFQPCLKLLWNNYVNLDFQLIAYFRSQSQPLQKSHNRPLHPKQNKNNQNTTPLQMHRTMAPTKFNRNRTRRRKKLKKSLLQMYLPMLSTMACQAMQIAIQRERLSRSNPQQQRQFPINSKVQSTRVGRNPGSNHGRLQFDVQSFHIQLEILRLSQKMRTPAVQIQSEVGSETFQALQDRLILPNSHEQTLLSRLADHNINNN